MYVYVYIYYICIYIYTHTYLAHGHVVFLSVAELPVLTTRRGTAIIFKPKSSKLPPVRPSSRISGSESESAHHAALCLYRIASVFCHAGHTSAHPKDLLWQQPAPPDTATLRTQGLAIHIYIYIYTHTRVSLSLSLSVSLSLSFFISISLSLYIYIYTYILAGCLHDVLEVPVGVVPRVRVLPITWAADIIYIYICVFIY